MHPKYERDSQNQESKVVQVLVKVVKYQPA